MRHRLILRGVQHLGVFDAKIALVERLIGASLLAQNDDLVRHGGPNCITSGTEYALTSSSRAAPAPDLPAEAFSEQDRWKASRRQSAACCRRCSPSRPAAEDWKHPSGWARCRSGPVSDAAPSDRLEYC